MSSLGWIKLHRTLLENPDFSTDPMLLGIFSYFLMKASREPGTFKVDGEPREFPKGTLCIGIRSLAAQFVMDKMTLKRRIDYLRQRDTIDTVAHTGGVIITIKNYSTYQGSEGSNDTLDDPNVRRDPPQTRSKNKNNTNTVFKFDLEEAYRRYPRKQGKSPGLKRLAPQIQTQEDYDNLLTAIDNYSRCETVKKGFIKLFSSFVGEWRDWIDPVNGTVSKPKPIIVEVEIK